MWEVVGCHDPDCQGVAGKICLDRDRHDMTRQARPGTTWQGRQDRSSLDEDRLARIELAGLARHDISRQARNATSGLGGSRPGETRLNLAMPQIN